VNRLAASLIGIVVACSTEPEDPRFVTSVPDRASFPAVADLLVRRCGSLDCHGTPYRNLRLYGGEGLRYAATDRPSSDPSTTTIAEYDEDFLSVVGLEPEVMRQVVSEGGARPERLTLVRKTRGTESHKGLTLFREGDEQDRCVTSWLAGRTDAALCVRARSMSP
jgi:hypothetical protein